MDLGRQGGRHDVRMSHSVYLGDNHASHTCFDGTRGTSCRLSTESCARSQDQLSYQFMALTKHCAKQIKCSQWYSSQFSNGLFPARYYDSLLRLRPPQGRSSASLFAARHTLGLRRSSTRTYSYDQCTTSISSTTPWSVIQSAVAGSNRYG